MRCPTRRRKCSSLLCFPGYEEDCLSRTSSLSYGVQRAGADQHDSGADDTAQQRGSAAGCRAAELRLLPAEPLVVAGVLLLACERAGVRTPRDLRAARTVAAECRWQLSAELQRRARAGRSCAVQRYLSRRGAAGA